MNKKPTLIQLEEQLTDLSRVIERMLRCPTKHRTELVTIVNSVYTNLTKVKAAMELNNTPRHNWRRIADHLGITVPQAMSHERSGLRKLGHPILFKKFRLYIDM